MTEQVTKYDASSLIQVHWQNVADWRQTEFVAQGGSFTDAAVMYAWIKEVVQRRQSECPAGWRPMVCDSTSNFFVWGAEPQAIEGDSNDSKNDP